MADRPVLFAGVKRAAQDALRSIQLHQSPDHARRLGLPSVGHEFFSGLNGRSFGSVHGYRCGRSLAQTFESIAKKTAIAA